MAKKKVLLIGESWVTSATHTKGFDQFGSVTFHLGAEPLVVARKDSDFILTYMPSHEAATGFPFDLEELKGFDAIILSDIGANTFLLPPKVWLNGRRTPNRLKLIREWTRAGGGLLMMGGYLSFQGIDGKARWRATPVEEALPVSCLPYDDRLEVPDGFAPQIVGNATLPSSPGSMTAGLCSSAPMKCVSKTRQASRFSPDSRRRREGILCSLKEPSERAVPWRGPPKSGRTGCRRASWPGRDIGVC